MKIVLFDADGTLYTAQFGYGLLKYASEHERKNRVRLYYASLVPDILLAKLFPSAVERFQRNIIARLAWRKSSSFSLEKKIWAATFL